MMKYGLIGRSLGHSFSRTFFEKFFKEQEVDAVYENIELENLTSFPDLKNEYVGFNVTIPYKEEIISYLDDLSEEAKAIGAVNVIEIIEGRTKGHNTDAFGFHQSIKPFLTNKHERAIIIGTGGASKAVAYVLKQLGIDVIFISRTPEGENQFSYDEVNNHMLNACLLIVNTTPVGMYPNVDECIAIPYEFLTPDHLLVDLIYNPEETCFLSRGKAKGATCINGETMLKQQALKSYQIWNS